MSKLTEDTYEKIIDFLLEKIDTLTVELTAAKALAQKRLNDSIDQFDASLKKPFPNKKDKHQWDIYKKKINEPRWHWYN